MAQNENHSSGDQTEQSHRAQEWSIACPNGHKVERESYPFSHARAEYWESVTVMDPYPGSTWVTTWVPYQVSPTLETHWWQPTFLYLFYPFPSSHSFLCFSISPLWLPPQVDPDNLGWRNDNKDSASLLEEVFLQTSHENQKPGNKSSSSQCMLIS